MTPRCCFLHPMSLRCASQLLHSPWTVGIRRTLLCRQTLRTPGRCRAGGSNLPEKPILQQINHAERVLVSFNQCFLILGQANAKKKKKRNLSEPMRAALKARAFRCQRRPAQAPRFFSPPAQTQQDFQGRTSLRSGRIRLPGNCSG